MYCSQNSAIYPETLFWLLRVVRKKGRGKNERDLIARFAPWKRGERIVEKCIAVARDEREGKDDIIPLSQFAKQIYAWDGPGSGIYDNV